MNIKANMTEQEIVKKDMDALYIGNLNTVEFDLKLPRKGIYNSAITWKSGHERFLSSTGKVTRPVYGAGNRTILLSATFTYGNAVGVKTYDVCILEEDRKQQISKVYAVELTVYAGESFYLPGVVIVDTREGDTISHPVVWNQGSDALCLESGNYHESGYLSGTSIPTEARITVQEKSIERKKDTTPRLRECREASVRLLSGSEFYRAQERMKTFLEGVDDDQMLYNFRMASGLDTKGASSMEGWDSPDCQLRGHTTGHYLSALALCFHATGDDRIKEKAVYMVHSLAECQKSFQKTEGIQSGFLSAYSEEQFDQLETYTPYPTIWAPYYTLHKLVAGFLDCYMYLGSEEALQIAEQMGSWVWNRLSRLSHEQLCKMWSMYIAGEFGGMNAVMAQLYQYTGKAEFLQCARLFDNDKLFYPLKMKVDALSGMHANQHIPQILGALEIFKSDGSKEYYEIAHQFWQFVTQARTYAIGGTGEGEMFHEKGKLAAYLTKNTEETCASYNMLKLTKELYQYECFSRYMDYYENVVTNHILATQEKDITGESTYFLPLAPGSRKVFERENSCCHGTGMESHFKYREGIYYHSEEDVYINLFIPSEMVWEDKEITVKQNFDDGRPERIKMTAKGGFQQLFIRRPDWVADDYGVIVNGEVWKCRENPQGYFVIPRGEQESLEIELNYPFHMQRIAAPDMPEKVAIRYGPYIMAALSEASEYYELPSEEIMELEAEYLSGETGFIFRGIKWIPLCMVGMETYHVYYIEKL